MRANGILMHLSSIPSPYGIGTMGQSAREFIDFLKKAGQKFWQILPVCPTSFGDSPYQSFSTFAGNPYFIDLDELQKEGLLDVADFANINWGSDPSKVDYAAIYENRFNVLDKAFRKFAENVPADYMKFCDEQKFWLDEYAVFMTLKDNNEGAAWSQWKNGLKKRDPEVMYLVNVLYEDKIEFWKFVQYYFYKQWNALLKYANEKDITIIGDLPIYVALDSADVWSNPDMFQLDANLVPTKVAGCPPDGFSATGQLWGNPLYRWDVLAKDNYAWWVKRIEYACKTYNVLRLDHFRGFESYYAIPNGAPDASVGKWEKGPGMALFNTIEKTIGIQNIIAEDLGFLTEPVRAMLKESGFPGMKVLELAFDSRDDSSNEYLTHNFVPDCVAYVGTHDNETINGWFETASKEDVEYAKEYLGITDMTDVNWKVMKALWASIAEVTLVQAQDVLGLGKESRMNTPSTLGTNWMFRALPGSFNDALAERLAMNMKLYQR